MEEMSPPIEEKKSRFVKNPYFWLILGIIVVAIIVRIYFFNANHGNQWYDESIYLMKSKIMAEEGISQGLLSYGWHRGFVMEIFWSLFFRMGIGEIATRITGLILSVLAVFLTYLIGKELSNKKAALIAASFMAVFWLALFYTARVMLTIPTLFLWTLVCYLFWIGYVKKKIGWIMVLVGTLLVLGVFTSLLFAPLVIILGLFLLISDKFAFLKNKWFYGAIGAAILLTTPYLLWSNTHLESPFAYWGATLSVGATYDKVFSANSGIMGYINFFPTYLGTLFLIIFFIGLIKQLDLFLGLDLLVKGDEKMKKKLFLLLWIVGPIILNSILVPAFSVDYYLMQIFPAVFLVVGEGIVLIGDLAEKYKKNIGIVVAIILVLIGGYTQLKMADNSISFKADSFSEVRESGLWIKADSQNTSDLIASRSWVMTAYFSERGVLMIPDNETEFNQIIQEKNPRYMIISIYENPPPWSFDYHLRYNDTWEPVKVYTRNSNGQESPTLLILKRK